MNAGLAAIFGALIGAVSTLATVLAYRTALITSREKEAAATDQWRRNHRRDTYMTHYRRPDQYW